MLAVDRLKERALALDAEGLRDALDGLAEAEQVTARAWVLADSEFFETVRREEPECLSSGDPGRELLGTGRWMRAMCLVALCSPVEAAQAMQWPDFWRHMRAPAREQTARLLAARPRDWARRFLTTTAGIRLSESDARHAASSLTWLVARGLADHDLPCPTGATFLEHYLHDSPIHPIDAERLRADRLVPDLVYLMIEGGFAGNLGALHRAVPELVADGTLHADRLLDACFQSLTSETRVSSQRVVAKILDVLDPSVAETPGGISFATGVIATCDGSVGGVLLPRALASVDSEADLMELTRVVAGRRERKQKRVLLAALRGTEMRSAVGSDGLVRALDLLAAGQDDASLIRDADAARAELGAPTAAGAAPSETAGLWHAEPSAEGARQRPWWYDARRDGWPRLLDRRTDAYEKAFAFTVDDFVRDMAGPRGPEDLVRVCRDLNAEGNLALTRFTSLVEPGFLAGRLRQLWPAALAVADDVASSRRTLAGLPELLRVLTRYALEVPDGWELPAHLARRAAANGDTKTQLEARALGAALARVPARAFTPVEVTTGSPPLRGLWEERPRVPVLARLLAPHYRPSTPGLHRSLDYLLAVGNGVNDRTRGGVGYALQMDQHLLDHLAVQVQMTDEDTVRRHVAGQRRHTGTDQGPVCRAIAAWQTGALTAATYDQVLATQATCGPALDNVVFAWACEQLVRLPSHPGSLCQPDSSGGTVGLMRLVERVRGFAGITTVGPLDLLLALARTRPEGFAADQAMAALDGVELWTDPQVTRTSDGAESFDVIPVLSRWIEDRDPGPTNLPVDLGLFTGLEGDLWGPASHEDVLRRVWPRDPRLAQDPPTPSYSGPGPVVLESGQLPSATWRRLLAETFAENTTTRGLALDHIVQLAQYDGVLDPAATVPGALFMLEEGSLRLTRFVESLQYLYERGCLRQLWPLGVAVAAAAAERSPKPTGLPFLLGCLTTYAREVPARSREVPCEIRALAHATGKTKSQQAARELVVALEAESRESA